MIVKIRKGELSAEVPTSAFEQIFQPAGWQLCGVCEEITHEPEVAKDAPVVGLPGEALTEDESGQEDEDEDEDAESEDEESDEDEDDLEEKPLSSLNLEELCSLASTYGIDTSGIRKKSEVRALIIEARKEG